LGDRRSASRLACLTARAARPIARVASSIAKRRAGCSVRAPSFAKVAIFAFPYHPGFFANSLSSADATAIAIRSRCSTSRFCLQPSFITNTCNVRHRQLSAGRRQWDRPVCQGRGVSVCRDEPLEVASVPICHWLFDNFNLCMNLRHQAENSWKAPNTKLSH
jgi:hypothetical protein